MRNRIFGVIWGGLILVNFFMTGGPQGAGAYKAGQTGALVFARCSLGKWSAEIAHDISEIEERSNSGNQRAGRPFVCLVLRECREHERLFMPDASQEGHE